VRRSILAAFTLVTLVSCTGARTEGAPLSPSTSTGGVSPSGETTPSVQPVTDYSTFAHALDAAGFTVRRRGQVGLPGKLLTVPGRQVFIDGVPASVFEYPTEGALDKVRSSISPRGDQIPTADGGLAIISWDPPHFYGAGKLLVLYFGDKQRTLDQLDLLLGPQFAGGSARA
jgi:hypothetical protein